MELGDRDHRRIHDFYIGAFSEFGDSDARSVQWKSRVGQQKRFRVLANVANLNGSSILDVGSGLGDLYRFFLEERTPVTYTGIDIVPEFVDAASSRFPEARFECKNVFEVEEQYNYVLASGALSFKVENNNEYYYSMIEKMYGLARKGVAFNMLRAGEHINNDKYVTYDPVAIATFASTFAERVEVVTDYLPQDFTVYLYR